MNSDPDKKEFNKLTNQSNGNRTNLIPAWGRIPLTDPSNVHSSFESTATLPDRITSEERQEEVKKPLSKSRHLFRLKNHYLY